MIRDTRKRACAVRSESCFNVERSNHCMQPVFSLDYACARGKRDGGPEKIMFCNTVRNFVLTAKFALLLLGTSIRLVLMAAYIRGRRRHSTCSSRADEKLGYSKRKTGLIYSMVVHWIRYRLNYILSVEICHHVPPWFTLIDSSSSSNACHIQHH